MRKIALAVTLTVTLALAMVGCANPQDKKTEQKGDPVKITYIHRLPDGEGMTKVADIVKRWNDANPGIQVTATKFDGKAQALAVKLETDIKANAGPCLAQLSYNEIPEMYVKGLLQDVTAEAKKYQKNYGGAFGQMTLAGKTTGLPQDSGPLVYLYDAKEFKALDIKVPTTLDEFKAAAAKAAAKGKYIAAFTPDETAYWLSAQTAAAGGVWYKTEGDKWKVNLDSLEAQKVAKFWQDMIDAKSVLTLDRWSDAYTKAIADGRLIGNLSAAWETGFALDGLDGTPREGQWRVAQIPDFGAGAKTGPDGGSGVAVMKGCAHPAEAMKFNDWFNTQVDDLATQGLVPAAVQPAKTPAKMARQFGGQDVRAVLAQANKNLSQDFIYIPGFSAVVPKTTETAAKVAAGNGKVADVFAAAKTSSFQALKSLGLPAI
ncbi:MAG: extracellular solute-binding protein [Propionibacteriaceae bacterium]|nr:extracellular solute-binding protein [Propionibacteriaceae bacterium]